MVKQKKSNKVTYYLGKLCPNGHEYLNTGKTLRQTHDHQCALCHRVYALNYLDKDRPTHMARLKKNGANSRRTAQTCYINTLLKSKGKKVTPKAVETHRRRLIAKRLRWGRIVPESKINQGNTPLASQAPLLTS